LYNFFYLSDCLQGRNNFVKTQVLGCIGLWVVASFMSSIKQCNWMWTGLVSAEELRKLTKNYRLGLGTFVDKTTMPYVSLEE